MRRFQSSFLSGAVVLTITGDDPVRFLDICSKNGIRLWDVFRSGENTYSVKMALSDVSFMRELRFGTGYKVTFEKKFGLPFYRKKLFRHKALLIGLILSIMLFIILSNMVWQVKVVGVPEDLEARIYTKLEQYGVYRGAFKWTIAEPNEIQQVLIEDLPELLWVGVQLNGTTYQLEAVEKRIVIREEVGEPQDLIASKNGVVRRIFIESGQPRVTVNDFVEKGKLLVSGEIERIIDNNSENEKKKILSLFERKVKFLQRLGIMLIQ